jgi:adenine-specific DNA glycosylase
MIGGGVEARNAHLALIELAATTCRPDRPYCSKCPLSDSCRRFGVSDEHPSLF